ncbi:MAG: hypothetical protein ACRD3J_13770 [Thermoanaerobaculia bacterium]
MSLLDNTYEQDGRAEAIVSALPSRSISELLGDDLELIEHTALASLLSASPAMVEAPDVDRAKFRAHVDETNRRMKPLFGFSPIYINKANHLAYSAV